MTRLFAGTQWDQPPRCDRCGHLQEECQCPPPGPEYLHPSKQTARVTTQRRKGGRTVTVVQDLRETETDLAHLLTLLKTHLGAGGSVRDETVEIQGDHPARVRDFLTSLGYRVR